MRILLLALALCAAAVPSWAQDSNNEAMVQVSQGLLADNPTEFYDRDTLTNSLYEQMRPRVKITNTEMPPADIDVKTRAYVADKYVPAMILTYAMSYDAMAKAGKHFASCSQPEEFGEGVIKTLCVAAPGETSVHYRTRLPNETAWKEEAEFIFQPFDGKLKLAGVNLLMPEGQEFFVEGL